MKKMKNGVDGKEREKEKRKVRKEMEMKNRKSVRRKEDLVCIHC